MNKIVLYFSIFFSLITNAQSSIGFIDNYSGVSSVIYNPVHIADNYLKRDIHLFSAYLNVGNNNSIFLFR